MEIPVIIKRLEAKFNVLVEQIRENNDEIDKLDKKLVETGGNKVKEEKDVQLSRMLRYDSGRIERDIEELIKKRNDATQRVELIQNSKFAVILTPEVITLREKCDEELANIRKEILNLPVYFGDVNSINISDLNISFRTPTL